MEVEYLTASTPYALQRQHGAAAAAKRGTLISRVPETNYEIYTLSNLITVQQDATYSVYYISVGNSTCFGC